MSASQNLTGGRLCGAVRYRLRGEPYDVVHCHCKAVAASAARPSLPGSPSGWPT